MNPLMLIIYMDSSQSLQEKRIYWKMVKTSFGKNSTYNFGHYTTLSYICCFSSWALLRGDHFLVIISVAISNHTQYHIFNVHELAFLETVALLGARIETRFSGSSKNQEVRNHVVLSIAYTASSRKSNFNWGIWINNVKQFQNHEAKLKACSKFFPDGSFMTIRIYFLPVG